jgi:hypothetical protein
MKGIVDRFEGEIVVIEVDGVTVDILKDIVDAGVKVGDSVECINGKWMTDEAATEHRAKNIKGLMDDVWEK